MSKSGTLSSTESVGPALHAVARGATPANLETGQLDFKQPSRTDKETCQDITEAVVCFANGSGGVVVLGVQDKQGGPEAFVGTDIDADVLRRRVYDLTQPRLLVDVEETYEAGTRLLLVRVSEGLDVAATTKGYAYRRIGTDCQPMSPDEITRLAEERRGTDWSSQATNRSLDQVEPAAMRIIRRLLPTAGREGTVDLARRSEADILRALGLVAGDRLTRAGEIMLCDVAPSCGDEVVVYQHRPTPGGEADAVLRLGTPVLVAFTEVLRAVQQRQGITPVTLRSGVQVQIDDFPAVAVREALANALVHGDYRLRRPVRVEHSPQSLRIQSPGPFVSGITEDNILTRGSRPRFASLVRVFRQLGLAEELGQGVDRIVREMVRSGRDIPEIRGDRDEVTVVFVGQVPNKRVARFVRDLPEAERDDTDTLLVVHALCRRPSVTARDMAPVMQRSVDEAQAVLHRLALGPAGLLEPTAGTRQRRLPNYRLRHGAAAELGPALAYQRRDTRELDEKVVGHLREYGHINNATLQRLFDVDVYQARDMLRDLVGREVLVRTSSQTRGKAVRYGPGPRFPQRRRAGR